MSEWEIHKPIGQCCGSERQIEPGQEYYGALVQTGEGLERRDFSIEYWENEQPEVYCFWKSRMPEPNQKKQRLFVDDDMLMSFFERLESEQEQEKVDFRFVLTLILMRKRKLKYDSSRTENGSEIWRLRVVGTRDMVDVVNPNLSEEKIEQLSSQLGQILHADLEE